MSSVTIDKLAEQARSLTREEQLELARRRLEQAEPETRGEPETSILDLIGMGKGTWKSAEDVRSYLEEERSSWAR